MEPKDWIVIGINAALVAFSCGILWTTVKRHDKIVEELCRDLNLHGNRLTKLESEHGVREEMTDFIRVLVSQNQRREWRGMEGH